MCRKEFADLLAYRDQEFFRVRGISVLQVSQGVVSEEGEESFMSGFETLYLLTGARGPSQGCRRLLLILCGGGVTIQRLIVGG